MKIYLVQRAFVPPPSEWKKGDSLLNTLNKDYMGSAEFEFGNVPRALARFIADTSPKVLDRQMLVCPHTKELFMVRYLIRQSQEKEFKDHLLDWDNVSKKFKERAPLYRDNLYLDDDYTKLFFIGIDEGREFFLWRSKMGKRLLKATIGNSIRLLKENSRYKDILANVEVNDDLTTIFHLTGPIDEMP